MKIFILGAGATGGLLAQVLKRRGHEVWCGDRDPERARRFIGRSIPCRPADACSQRSLVSAARGCDLLINTVPAVFNERAMRAALRLGADYLDMASHMERDPFKAEQLDFHRDFVRKGALALINAGAAPGLTNLLVASCARTLDEVDRVHIRLFEETSSRTPVSTWSAEVAFDEAIARPRIYRNGRFSLAPRFSEPEWCRFPSPIGPARVVLAAQDEVGTLPYFVPMNHLDVKIGGNEFERLRRWYRQGKLRPSERMSRRRFPATVTPDEMKGLFGEGILRNARFAMAVSVIGRKGLRWVEQRRICAIPSLHQLRRRRLLATPIAYAAAECAAAFVANMPRRLVGVYPPEALSATAHGAIVDDLRRQGFRFERRTIELDGTLFPERSDWPGRRRGLRLRDAV